MKDGAGLSRKGTALVVIDFQEGLMKAMEPSLREKAVKNLKALCEAAAVLSVPTLLTEQYPKGLGRTVPEVKERIGGEPIEKIVFSSCREERFMSALETLGRRSVVLTGVETHVCVLQTCLDLLERGYAVHVVENSVASRTIDDWSSGLRMMEKAGAWRTTAETAIFQLLERAGTDEFKRISKIVK